MSDYDDLSREELASNKQAAQAELDDANARLRDAEQALADLESKSLQRVSVLDKWAAENLKEPALGMYSMLTTEESKLAFQSGFSVGELMGIRQQTDHTWKWISAVLHGEEAFDDLTSYQRRVFALVIGDGMDYRRAGDVLSVSPEGVRYHMRQIAKLMGCKGVDDLRAMMLSTLAKVRNYATASGSDRPKDGPPKDPQEPTTANGVS